MIPLMIRMKWARRTVLALVATIGLGCSLGEGIVEPPARPGRRILFIGNQFTFLYNMPLIVEAMGDSADLSRLSVDMVAYADFNLRDHQLNGAAVPAINSEGWEFVVLQQGPSATDAARDQLREATKALSSMIRARNARPALYMTWPASNAQADFPRVIESYTLAASDVNGLLFPVAVAWQAAMRRDSSIPLYLGDGVNPSAYGSYLAAAVMFSKIYNRTPVGLPSRLLLRNGDVITIPAAQAAVLLDAAAEATGFGTPPT
jgi:hypothetical protein